MQDSLTRTAVTVTTTIATAPVRVWEVVTRQTSQWWQAPYLAPDRSMRLEAMLGGAVWDGESSGDGEPRGDLHGTIRHYEPFHKLEIGGVLVPEAFAGTITFTIEPTSFGSDLTVEHEAIGVDDDNLEAGLFLGWTQLLSRIGELAER